MNIKSERKQNYKNDIKIKKDMPVHEQKILENIKLSDYNYDNNLLETDMMVFKLKGKLEIIEILKKLNMITDYTYNLIVKKAGAIKNII